MGIQPRPLRSKLFVPGNKDDWMRKAPKYGADALIFDLEDAVPEHDRPRARQLVRAVLEDLGAQGQTLFIRVNALDTGQTFDDLEAVVCSGLHGILLPKVSSPRDVIVVDGALNWFERRAGVPEGSTIIQPLLESAAGLRQAYEIAVASPRIAYLGAGSAKGGDMARAVGYEWTPEGLETLFYRSKVLLDARAANIQYPMTGLWVDVRDTEGLRQFAQRSRQLGYVGMHAIYPGHVPVINDVFSPTPDEVAYWEELIGVLEEAERNGTTAVTFRDEMVDTAMVKTGRDRLALARRLGTSAP
ncbi:MAG TPA: CoA ester lyase [Dehalococcoidia bacterium]|nr:CoA ester lyase [Dehalococcoidia bacterium]